MGTHQSLQSADVAAEKVKREGGANGVGELPNWGKMGESGKEEEKGEVEGEMVCSRPPTGLMVERVR